MAKYSIEDTILTAIANCVRGLVTAGAMTPSGMATNLQNAAEEVNDQGTLITQIKAALDGKAVEGGGGSSVETCQIEVTMKQTGFTFYYTNMEGEISSITPATKTFTMECVKNTLVFVNNYTAFGTKAPSVTGSVTTIVDNDGAYYAFYSGSDGTITAN